jgi:hypothetical protein
VRDLGTVEVRQGTLSDATRVRRLRRIDAYCSGVSAMPTAPTK